MIVTQVTASVHGVITLVLRQDASNIVLSNMRQVQHIRQNSVAVIMANSCCDCTYRLEVVGMHQHCDFVDLEFSSDRSWPTCMLNIFQTVSTLCRMFVT
jgi:hypothetical protein